MRRAATSILLCVAAATLGCKDRNVRPNTATITTVAMPASAESVHVEMGACPFECCQYGRWRADSAVVLYARRDTASEHIGDVPRGMVVRALTGAVHVRPGRLVLRRSLDSGFAAGDTLAIHSYVGEGHWRVRRAGTRDSLVDRPLQSTDTACLSSGTRPARCDGELLYAPVQVWWARIQLQNAVAGWTPRADLFAGADACGVYDPPIDSAPR